MLLTVQYYTTACERSTQTQTRREEKRIKCVINCSMLLSTVHGRRRRTVFVQIYCEILSPFRLTRRSPRLTRQQLPRAERAVCREGRYFCRQPAARTCCLSGGPCPGFLSSHRCWERPRPVEYLSTVVFHLGYSRFTGTVVMFMVFV